MRHNWVNHTITQLSSPRIPGIQFKLKTPGRGELIKWTKSAWEHLNTSVIQNGFKHLFGDIQFVHSDSDREAAETLMNLESALVDSLGRNAMKRSLRFPQELLS